LNKEEKIKEELPKPILIKNLGMIFATENSKTKFRYGIYKCGFCGNEFRTQTSLVKGGHTKSCGCSKFISTKTTLIYSISKFCFTILRCKYHT
jgi:hypothetical protein